MSGARTTEDVLRRRLERQKHKVAVLEQIIEDKTRELFRSNENLREANEQLEERVAARTAQLGEALIRAEAASKAKSTFLAQMSHELRTPLHGLIGTIDTLVDTDASPRQRRLIEIAQRSGDHLLTVIGDILDFTRIESGTLTLEELPTDVVMLVEQIVEQHAGRVAGQGLRLWTTLPANVPLIVADPTRLRQVLDNLISNALKFTTEGGVTVDLAAESGGGSVRLDWSVSDTGIGIPAEKLATIFDPFIQAGAAITRRFGGTGLGLPICRRLVNAMGGDIQAESTDGEGSVFRFTTCHAVAAARALEVEAETVTLPEGLRVLLVDDQPINRLLGREMLVGLGCAVFLAENGHEALEVVDAQDPGLILMDCHMPVLSGAATATLLRRRGFTMPIIALSADVSPENRAEVIAAGMQGLLGKPYRRRQLAAVISETLDHPIDAGPVKIEQERVLFSEADALQITSGSRELLGQLVSLFLAQLDIYDAQLRRAETPDGLRQSAHALWGASAHVGAHALCSVSRTVETAAAGGRLDHQGRRELIALIAETRREMKAWIDDRKRAVG